MVLKINLEKLFNFFKLKEISLTKEFYSAYLNL